MSDERPATHLTREDQKEAFKEAIKELFLEQYVEFGIFTAKFVLRTLVLGVFGGVGWLWYLLQQPSPHK